MRIALVDDEPMELDILHDKDVFHMSNGCKIPISRRKSKDVQNAYMKFCFEQVRKEINSATDVAQ